MIKVGFSPEDEGAYLAPKRIVAREIIDRVKEIEEVSRQAERESVKTADGRYRKFVLESGELSVLQNQNVMYVRKGTIGTYLRSIDLDPKNSNPFAPIVIMTQYNAEQMLRYYPESAKIWLFLPGELKQRLPLQTYYSFGVTGSENNWVSSGLYTQVMRVGELPSIPNRFSYALEMYQGDLHFVRTMLEQIYTFSIHLNKQLHNPSSPGIIQRLFKGITSFHRGISQ